MIEEKKGISSYPSSSPENFFFRFSKMAGHNVKSATVDQNTMRGFLFNRGYDEMFYSRAFFKI